MRVIINGAGIGGLTLAQALREQCEVIVLERDAEAVATGGYRLAINGPATAVLERHLDADLMRRIRSVSDGTDHFAQFTVATSSLRPLLIGRQDPTEDRLLAQRRALRLLLTSGIEDRIRWSTAVLSVEQGAHGADVILESGERLAADLVVGAEGVRSPTVASVRNGPANDDLRLVGIAGSAPRRHGTPMPSYLARGPALAFSHDGVGIFLSLTSSGSGPVESELQRAVGPASLVWGLIAPTELLPSAARASPTELIARSAAAVEGWHPWLRERMLASDPDRVAAFTFRAADPRSDLTPWTPRHVTALGDAIHAMPPTGGQAASTAIRDAGSLAEHLRGWLQRAGDLQQALARYHRDLGAWARPALRESLGPVRIIRTLQNPIARTIAFPLLRLIDLAPPFRD